MALFFADLVREASWDTGTGDLTLGGAVPGHRRFADAVPAGARFQYCIAGVTAPDEWETGEGEIGEDGKLVRAPLTSSADDQPVDFSPGLKTVSLTVAAAWFTAMDGAGEIDPDQLAQKADLSGAAFSGAVSIPSLTLGTDLALSEGGTGASTAAGARASLGIVPGVDVEPHAPVLTALAALDEQAGLVEQIAADSFAKREIGVGSASALPTRADADARYQPLDADLSAIAASATTSFGRALLTETNAASLRSTAGLGSAATRNTGTSGANIPLLNEANVWTGAQEVQQLIYTTGASAGLVVGNRDGSGSWVVYDSGDVLRLYDGSTDRASFSANGIATTGDIAIGGSNLSFSWTASHNRMVGAQFLTSYETSVRFLEATRETRIVAKSGDGPDAGVISFHTGSAPTERARIDGGVFTYGGLEIGYRDLPRVTGGLERGKCLAASAGVTINAGPAAGSVYTIYNDSGSSITLSQGSGLTLRLGGSASTGNRTLAARGFATLWFNSTNEAIVTGTGLS